MAAQEEDRSSETRRYLLGSAVRITPKMAPALHAVVSHCRDALKVEDAIELYVSPSPHYNAFSYGGGNGRTFVGLTSALVESFSDDELRFVVGHELGHYIFDHHAIPLGRLLKGEEKIGPEQALQLFAWQRYAEISADRAGLLCAASLDATARGFFKIASGLKGHYINFDLDAYLAQIGDIESEAAKARQSDERPRSDWFASHPFSPLRVRAAQLCAGSELCTDGGTPLARLEAEVQNLMMLMEPSYLLDKSDAGEAMRRVLLAAGVLVACADGKVDPREVAALEGYLGQGSLPGELSPKALRENLDSRIAMALSNVPPLRRAQLVRDLCVIAMADGHSADPEIALMREVAARLEVDPTVVEHALAALRTGLD